MFKRCNTLDSRLFQDGCQFEEEVLGRCMVRYSGYMQWAKAAQLVRNHQPARKTEILAALEREFERRVGEQVPFYTAVGSSMDFDHGVDGFCEFRGVVVTIDVTKNPEKTCGKADVVVHPDDLENLPALTARIARVLVSKIERRGR